MSSKTCAQSNRSPETKGWDSWPTLIRIQEGGEVLRSWDGRHHRRASSLVVPMPKKAFYASEAAQLGVSRGFLGLGGIGLRLRIGDAPLEQLA